MPKDMTWHTVEKQFPPPGHWRTCNFQFLSVSSHAFFQKILAFSNGCPCTIRILEGLHHNISWVCRCLCHSTSSPTRWLCEHLEVGKYILRVAENMSIFSFEHLLCKQKYMFTQMSCHKLSNPAPMSCHLGVSSVLLSIPISFSLQ